MANRFLTQGDEPAETVFIFVMLPFEIEPDEREARFGQQLDAELRLEGIGYVSGGGQLLDAPDDTGNRAVLFCGVDINTIDLDAARSVLRRHLPELGCPDGTCVQYDEYQDCFDGGKWRLCERRDQGE